MIAEFRLQNNSELIGRWVRTDDYFVPPRIGERVEFFGEGAFRVRDIIWKTASEVILLIEAMPPGSASA